jgi:hypothetical protein
MHELEPIHHLHRGCLHERRNRLQPENVPVQGNIYIFCRPLFVQSDHLSSKINRRSSGFRRISQVASNCIAMATSRCTFFMLLVLTVTMAAARPADDLMNSVAEGDHQSALQQVGHGTSANEANSEGKLPLVLAGAQMSPLCLSRCLCQRPNSQK